MIFDHGTNSRVYAGTDDALWAGTTTNDSSPLPVSWRKITTSNLLDIDIWSLTTFPQSPNVIYAGTAGKGAEAIILVPPINQNAPTITGPNSPPQVGDVLTAHKGTWDGTPSIDYTYQWRQCPNASGGSGCTDIANATQSTYVVTRADRTANSNQDYLRVVVSATNDAPSFESVSASSDNAGPVAASAGDYPGFNQRSSATVHDTTAATAGRSFLQVGDTVEAEGLVVQPG